MSFCYRQLLTPARHFFDKHPGEWLVWEPGDWKAPRAAAKTEFSHQAHQPRTGDSLCFYLGTGISKPAPLKVGREPSNQIVLNDATVSRLHLVVEPIKAGGWSVLAQKKVLLSGSELEPDARAVLASGAKLQLGQVLLTFLDRAAFEER